MALRSYQYMVQALITPTPVPTAKPEVVAETDSGSRLDAYLFDWLSDPVLAGYSLSSLDWYGADDDSGTNETALTQTSDAPWKEDHWQYYRVEATATKSGSPNITTSSDYKHVRDIVPTAWHGLGGEAGWISFSNVTDTTIEQVTGDLYLSGGLPTLTNDTDKGGAKALTSNTGFYYSQSGGMDDVPNQQRFALSYWVKWVSNDASQPAFAGVVEETATGSSAGERRLSYDISSSATNAGWFAGKTISGNSYVQSVTGCIQSPLNEWHHIIAEFHEGTYTQSQRWYYNGTRFDCTEVQSGYLGYLTNRANIPWIMTVGGSPWSPTVFANAYIDDVRVFINEPFNRNHWNALYRGRGYNGRIGKTEINFRDSYNYVANPLGSSYAHDTQTYDSRDGWGWSSAVTGLNRSTSVDARIAGIHYTSTDGVYFRYDLPNGPGTYRVHAGVCNAGTGAAVTGWNFRDGVGGTSLHTLTEPTNSGTDAVDITGQHIASTDFFANEDYVELTFTSDHLAVTRDTSLVTGQGAISYLAVEPVTVTPPSFNPAWAMPQLNSTIGLFQC